MNSTKAGRAQAATQRVSMRLGEALSAEAIEAIDGLCEQAGIECARRSLRERDDLPF